MPKANKQKSHYEEEEKECSHMTHLKLIYKFLKVWRKKI